MTKIGNVDSFVLIGVDNSTEVNAVKDKLKGHATLVHSEVTKSDEIVCLFKFIKKAKHDPQAKRLEDIWHAFFEQNIPSNLCTGDVYVISDHSNCVNTLH